MEDYGVSEESDGFLLYWHGFYRANESAMLLLKLSFLMMVIPWAYAIE